MSLPAPRPAPRPAAPLAALLDPASPADRFVLERFGPTMAAVNPALFELTPPPHVPGRTLLFERWARLEGILDGEDRLHLLPPERLSAALVEFETWRSLPMPADHPLSGRAQERHVRKRLGWRLGTDGAGKATLYADVRALRWWCRTLGIPDWVCDAAEEVTAAERPTRRSILLTDDDVARVIRVLVEEAVPLPRCPPGRVKAWHARQLAVFTVQLWGSLRISEVGRLDDRRITVGHDRLVARLPVTKTGSRTVELFPRDDAACPLAAIAAWLRAAERCNYDRGGALLPFVLLKARRGRQPLRRPTAPQELANFRRVLDAAGVTTDDADIGDDPTCVRTSFGTHGLRALLPDRAIDAGRSISWVKRLGAWAREDSPYRWYLRKDPSLAAARVMADDLAGEGDQAAD